MVMLPEGWSLSPPGGGSAPRDLDFNDDAVAENYIREKAGALGIDPETAVKVARSEGLGSSWQSGLSYKGGRERSYGDFQLFIDGGLGNEYMQQTGLDPTDKRNRFSMIDFALENAAKNKSWAPFHGAKRVGIAHNVGFDGPMRMGPAEGTGIDLPEGWTTTAPGKVDDTGVAAAVEQEAAEGGQRQRADITPYDPTKSTIEQAKENFVPSAVNFGSDMWDMVTNPVETVKGIKNVAMGAMAKAGIADQDYEKYMDGVLDFYAERYGSLDGFKKAVATDPVSVMADAAMALTGGGGALAKAGQAGRIGSLATAGKIAKGIGTAIDPIAAPVKVAGKVLGKPAGALATSTLAGTTGSGRKAVQEAFESGKAGGSRGAAFRGHMRGSADMMEPVEAARNATGYMRGQRGIEYQRELAKSGLQSERILPADVQSALGDLEVGYKSYGANVVPNDAGGVAKTRRQIMAAVDDWAAQDQALGASHNAEALDQIKQHIGSIRDAARPGSAEYALATDAYNRVRQVLFNKAPKYKKIMADYEKASDMIREVERALGTGNRAHAETALRKLQSSVTDHSTSSWGRRQQLVKVLEEHGATNLLTMLAGQNMSSLAPKGLSKGIAGGIVGVGAMAMNPATIGYALASSPRMVGEAVHTAGRLSNKVPGVTNILRGANIQRNTLREDIR